MPSTTLGRPKLSISGAYEEEEIIFSTEGIPERERRFDPRLLLTTLDFSLAIGWSSWPSRPESFVYCIALER